MARKLIIAALVLGSQLALAFPLAHVAADSPARTVCFQRCVSCTQRCKHDKVCLQTCFQLKRASCQAAGLGPGPSRTCSCT